MMNRISSRVVAAVLLSLSLVANAQSLRYSRGSREVVQARLARDRDLPPSALTLVESIALSQRFKSAIEIQVVFR